MSFMKIISTNSLFAPFVKFVALKKSAPRYLKCISHCLDAVHIPGNGTTNCYDFGVTAVTVIHCYTNYIGTALYMYRTVHSSRYRTL